jgi:hypothetical protein
MFVSCYHELCKTFDGGLDVIVIIRIFHYCVDAHIAVHRLSDECDRCSPQIQIPSEALLYLELWICERAA